LGDIPLRRHVWLHETARLLRFGIVGVVATLTHYVLALVMVAVAGLPAQAAHVMGFLAAVPVSFLGHYHWTFRSSVNYSRAARRFFAAAAGAFLVSAMLLEVLNRLTTWDVAATILVCVLVIPGVSYVINRVFVF